MRDPDADDLDRLFLAAGDEPPPATIGARARERVRAIRGARRLTMIAAIDLGALMGMAVLAYLLGAALAGGELPALVRLAVEDRALVLEARREFGRALLLAVPWRYVAAVALNGLALYALTAFLLRATDRLGGATRRVSR